MCGLTGIYHPATLGNSISPSLAATLDAMTDALAHRGPDSRGTWLDNSRGVGLGHRRLAIRDLSPSGHQPMTSSCGRYVIAYNGEVYSHKEISHDLFARGRSLRGSSDTEVILEACAEWGVEYTAKRLIGMFAFALFDRQTGEMHLVRDRLGIKPLYWGVIHGRLMFGSELKALRAAPGWEPRIDRDAVSTFLRHNYIPAPRSIYQGVSKLWPGHILKFSPNGTTAISCFWSLRDVVEQGLKQPLDIPEAQMEEQIDDLLADAVQRRMVSDVPIGALLSGGVDSSLVTALMAEHSPRQINTFSIGFHEPEFNEAPYASEIAKHIGTHHTELYVEPRQALDVVEKLPYWYDEPFADSSQIPTALVCALTRQHVSVVLSGDGGDELFAGYSRYELALETWGKAARSPTSIRDFFARLALRQPTQRLDTLSHYLPKRWQRPQFGSKVHEMAKAMLIGSPDALYRRMLSHWNDPDAVVNGGHEVKGILWDQSVPRTIPDFLDRMQFLDTATYLPDDILTKVDRASMSVALEARVPLLDHRIVEASWRLPQRMKRRDGQNKWILRQCLYKRVPRHLIDRPKMGFGVPLEHWLRGSLRDWAETLLAPERLKSQGLIAVEPIQACWAAHLRGENWSYPLWDVLMLQAWLSANPDIAF